MFWTRFNSFGNGVWNQVQDLQAEMGRFFDRWRNVRDFGAPSFPAINVWEEEDTLHVEAEMPGLTLENVEIFVTGHNQLTIKGERRPDASESATLHRRERGFGSFVRTLTLPFPVDEDKVDARLENGVLTVRLPKHEAARPRKIQVKG